MNEDGMDDFEGEIKTLLLGILKAYVEDGESELAANKLGHFMTARYGSVSEGKTVLGELSEVKDAFKRMQQGLY